jgi:ABC-type phosphate transport system substrate-binding protein
MTGRMTGASRRIGVIAVGAGIVASLAFAGPSFAAPPATGTACQPDGRVHAGGATLANNAQRVVFEPGYRRDFCGPVPGGPTDANNEPDSGSRMVLYNFVGRPTGSGSGINGANCRADAFEGSDVPYTIAQLQAMRGAKPAAGDPNCATFVSAPFAPQPAYPDTADATNVGIMSFPIAGAAVTIGFNLNAAACGGSTPPTAIQLDSLQASRLFGGQVATWNDAALVAIQPAGSTLANCTAAVSRVGRSDNSGTTTIFKSYLNKADGSRALCDGTTWSARTGQNGSNFPAGGSCTTVNYFSGNPAVVNGIAATVGAVGYGDLADFRTLQPGLGIATVRNQSNDNYVSPVNSTASNCSFAGTQLPAGGANGAVGVAGNAWASDLPVATNRSDVTFIGNGYPICGYTFALVRPQSGGAGTGAVSRLNDNQRRTVYSYFQYVLSPTTQAALSTNFYAPVPSAFLTTIRSGFTANF